MKNIYIGIGSNLGDKFENIQIALNELSTYIQIEKISSIYETPPFGFQSSEDFYNIVLKGSTQLTPQQLLKKNQFVEKKMGRAIYNDGQYHSRIIDLDILLYNKEYIQEINLKIPHPEITNRNFVLLPLIEIAPDIKNPIKPYDSFSSSIIPSLRRKIKKLKKRLLIPEKNR